MLKNELRQLKQTEVARLADRNTDSVFNDSRRKTQSVLDTIGIINSR